MRKPHRIAIALSVLTITAWLGAASVASAQSTPYCGITWGSLEKAVLQTTSAPVTNARTGRHDCWDRLVLDFNGTPASGYDVRYVDSYTTEGPRTPLSVTGGAIISVRAFAPANVPWNPGNHVVSPSQFTADGYRTFRDLVYGGSDGLNTGFGLGVRARLPFRVFTLTGPGDTSRLVVDVAHQW